jgi:hypothetical protein
MLKLLGVVIVIGSIGPLGVGVAGIALSAWGRDWGGLALSTLALAVGMALADGGRYLWRRGAE